MNLQVCKYGTFKFQNWVHNIPLPTRLITTGARSLKLWFTKVRKIKAIYHCLNLFSFDVTQKALVAECWMPEHDIPLIQAALNRGADLSGSTIPPILNTVAAAQGRYSVQS